MNVTCVTIDCDDPAKVAEFWNAALHYGGVAVSAGGGGAVCGPPDGGMYLEFIRVPESKTVKNRLHFGCGAGTLEELEVELERLFALGATIAWEEDFPPDIAAQYRNIILRDVEGNEFLSRSRRDAMTRLPFITEDQLDEKQRKIWDGILSTRGKNGLNGEGGLIGPFNSML